MCENVTIPMVRKEQQSSVVLKVKTVGRNLDLFENVGNMEKEWKLQCEKVKWKCWCEPGRTTVN